MLSVALGVPALAIAIALVRRLVPLVLEIRRFESPGRSTLVAVGLAAAGLAAAVLVALFVLPPSSDPTASLVRQLAVAAIAVIPVGVAAFRSGEGWRGVGLGRRNAGRSIVLGLALASIWLAAAGKLDALARIDLARLQLLAAFAGVAASEELVYRGYLQPRAVAWLGKLRGIAFAAAVFGLLHLPQRLLAGVTGLDLVAQLVVVLVLGSIFGVVFHATSSVVAGTILHAVMDWAERL